MGIREETKQPIGFLGMGEWRDLWRVLQRRARRAALLRTEGRRAREFVAIGERWDVVA